MTATTVVIPTRDRPGRLTTAIASALDQTDPPEQVLIVDDGSSPPVDDHPDLRVEVVRHLRPRGVAAARNTGIALTRTPFIAFLDDDDRLRPRFLETSHTALAATSVSPPVGCLSTLVVTDDTGHVRGRRVPPPLRERGQHFSLEPAAPGESYFGKQTLVVPTDVLRAIHGFDETLRSRVTTELFWRLNPVCSLIGVDEPTYELTEHAGPRISHDRRLRQRSFRQLLRAHRELLASHPDGLRTLLANHVRTSLQARQPLGALEAAVRHLLVRDLRR